MGPTIASLLRNRPGMSIAPLIAVMATGCGGSIPAPSSAGTSPPLTVQAQDGPTELTLTLRPASPVAGEIAHLQLRALSAKGGSVAIEDYRKSAESTERHFEYRIRPTGRRSAVPTADGRLEWNEDFEIEFLLAGEQDLPPARLVVTPATASSSGAGPSGDAIAEAKPTTLATAPLKVTVADTAGTRLSPDELRQLPMPPPVDLPRPWAQYWPVYAGAGALVLLAATLLMARRRQGDEATVPVPAHEWARRMIGELIADDLLSRNRAQEFFYRVSGIVRGYIERRFGLSAPEMTTEEFLSAASSDSRFPAEHAAAMAPFLRACDLVKYAKHEPRPADGDEALRTARDFVERTRSTDDEPPTKSHDPASPGMMGRRR